MENFINIHSHLFHYEHQVCSIRNLFAHEPVPEKGFFSIGWHPWHLNDFQSIDIFKKLKEKAAFSQIVAIGETGLDKAINIDWSKQMDVFRFHVEIAIQQQKPLIIHCVRAYAELILFKKQFKTDIPWIIHGYRGNIQTTIQLLKHDFYFSFGDSLFEQNSKSVQSLLSLPINRLFIETDESNCSIKSIYKKAANLLDCSERDLVAQISKNFQTCFNL